MLDSINLDQNLYVMSAGKGYTCLGFDVARDRTLMYIELMGGTAPADMPHGTREAYDLYQRVEAQYVSHPASRGTTFDPHTPDRVKEILEAARRSRRRLRLYYGNRLSGLDWNEENDTTGYVGRSMGPIRVPLLIKSIASSGGPAILTNCIVKIQRTSDKQVVWQHSEYHTRSFTIGPAKDQGYAEAVYRDGDLHAQFRHRGQATRFIDTMLGRRMP
jgi:hypothetical protein